MSYFVYNGDWSGVMLVRFFIYHLDLFVNQDLRDCHHF